MVVNIIATEAATVPGNLPVTAPKAKGETKAVGTDPRQSPAVMTMFVAVHEHPQGSKVCIAMLHADVK